MKKNKTISVILTVALLTSGVAMYNTSVSAAETNTKKVLGDVNNDNVINVNDVTGIQKFIADIADLTDNQKFVADTNGDNRLTILDATELQKYVADYTAVNKNIGKTWSDAITETVTHPAETAKTTKLRYAYLVVNVCNVCDTPFINPDGTTYPPGDHNAETGHGGYRTQYDWYYVDDNNIYHDLDDDGHVPHKIANTEYENEKNVFDPEFDPYWGWVAIDAYNNTHNDQYSKTSTIWSYCHDCNADGTSIYDENGNVTNYKNDGQFKITQPVEITIYPDVVADRNAYEKAYNDALTAVEKHKAYHERLGDIPPRYGEAEARVAEKYKIYKTSETVIKDAWTETVTIREAGWY